MSKTLLFTSPACAPCKMMKNDLDKLGLMDRVTLIDTSDSNSLPMMTAYGVRSVPALIVLDDDEEIVRVRVGYTGDIRDLEGLII